VEGIDPELEKYSGSIIVFDRGYSSFSLFKRLTEENIVFVTRLKTKIVYEVISTEEINKAGVIKDEIIKFTGDKVKRNFKGNLRLVTYKESVTGKEFKFLTNNFEYSPKTIAYLYKKRWEIEIFFKWIKQNLVIKKYFGYSENAVKIQVWSSFISYLLIVYVKESISFNGSMLEFTRLIRESLFKNIGLIDIKHKKFISRYTSKPSDGSQTNLFDL